MKKIFTVLLFAISVMSYAQLSMRTDKKELLDRFKNTETVFILSNAYETKVYDDILKQTWTVTPYKIIKIEDFNPLEYMDDKHSFAMLDGNVVIKKNGSYLHSYMSFFIFDHEDKLKEIEKFKKKTGKKRDDYDLMRENRITIADFFLYKNADFIKKNESGPIAGKEMPNDNMIRIIRYLTDEMYMDDNVFHNYKPGFLKNYFQKVNALITEGKPYGLYGGACTAEIKQLKNKTLYVPQYVGLKYNAMSRTETDKTQENKTKLFEDYKYNYEYIDTDKLSDRIMAGEEFYYLRYVMENAQKYVQVVNSKTGEIIYKNYHPMSYNLNEGNIEDIRKAIEKGKV
ncbi:hypothetical protein LRS05_03970 [Flavobacterium sp. J372]|uniref:hypothetical protein n=1 Tax=Flavobacterium sp. J372 TaxID=2898436 RepID=UPI002151509D|nr:hypothetical protein [Flavobacterium sp. J372]MCR5861357.1 hypothetical protein [Flavobacterium sp. J372]